MIDRKFFLGFVRIHVLYHAGSEKVYGVWLMNELARHGYNISPGTMYPILHEMEKDGYLMCEEELVEGKIRKYYSLTKKGKTMLIQSREMAQELLKELTEGSWWLQ
jgi:DNA-binding PadR family transcriptional regulator